MRDVHRGFDLVAVLPSGTRCAAEADLAILQQQFLIKRGGV
jgi:hypothetical protein